MTPPFFKGMGGVKKNEAVKVKKVMSWESVWISFV